MSGPKTLTADDAATLRTITTQLMRQHKFSPVGHIVAPLIALAERAEGTRT